MPKGLTREEIKKLLEVFCPRDVEIIISKFSASDIRKVINNPTMQKQLHFTLKAIKTIITKFVYGVVQGCSSRM